MAEVLCDPEVVDGGLSPLTSMLFAPEAAAENRGPLFGFWSSDRYSFLGGGRAPEALEGECPLDELWPLDVGRDCSRDRFEGS